MVKFVISPEYFGSNDSKSSIRTQLRNLGAYSVEIDESTGFVSALMTLDNFNEFILGIKNRVMYTMDRLKKAYAGIKNIKANPDYSIFDIEISRLKKVDRIQVGLELLLVSTTYQVISGIPQIDTSIKVKYYNKDNKLVDSLELPRERGVLI